MGVGRQRGDESRYLPKGFRTEWLNAWVFAAAKHVVAGVVLATERARIRGRETRLNRERSLCAVDVPVVC